MSYRYLWTPLQLGPVSTRNRIVFSAHLTNYARDGKPTEQHAAYYGARAAGGTGLIIIVGLAVLATEFVWAERALDRTTATAATAASKVTNNAAGKRALVLSGVCMVIGGALVVTLLGDHRVIGVSVLIAGLIGLATLLPAVQRWIDGRIQPPLAAPDEPLVD